MGWLKLLLERKLIVGLAFLMLIVGSLFFFDKLENQFYPEVNYDTATISAHADNMPALDVEEKITFPIEEKISGLEGITSYESVSSEGLSSIKVSFKEGDGDEAYEQLKDAMSDIQNQIPVTELETLRSTTAQLYEMFMDMHSGDLSVMTNFTESVLKPRLESLSEVQRVRIIGQNEQQVQIQLSYELLNKHNLEFEDIEKILQQENSNVSLGNSDNNSELPTLRWDTRLDSLKQIEDILIPSDEGVISLGNIADISLIESRNNQELWRDGDNNYVWVSIGRTNDVTQSEMTNAVRDEIEKIKNEGHLDGFILEETIVQSDFVKDSIGSLQGNVIIGAVLVIIVLLAVLRNFMATAIIGVTIPITVLLTFLLMGLFDVSINLISILALGIALGMIVDSSIVILESIYKKKESGLDPRTATIQGTKEVFTPVLASTLTTITVFLPIGLISGQVGEFAKVLSLVIVFSQVISIIISFTFIPVLSEKMLRVKRKEAISKPNKIMTKYNQYIDWISKNTKRKIGVVFLFLLIAASSLLLTFAVPLTLIPDFYNRQAEFYVGLEQNTTPEDRENVAQGISEHLSSTPDVEGYNVRTLDRNRMYVYVKMTPEDQATMSQDEINELIYKKLREMSDDYPVTASGSVTYPIQISIRGQEMEKIQAVTDDLVSELSQIDGIQGLTSTINNSNEEKLVSINKSSLIRDDLTPSNIKNTLDLLSTNREVGSVNTDEGIIPMNLSFNTDLHDEGSLNEIMVSTEDGERPLSLYVNYENGFSPLEINHHNGERTIQIVGDIQGRDLGTVSSQVFDVINDYSIDPGYSIEVGGEIQQQQDASNEMYLVLVLALLFVFGIMAIQFNSLIHPLVIMFIIPLTLTGVLIGLFSTQTELNLLSAMGMLILIGIVTNNGILLIDRIKQLRLENIPRYDAIKQASKERIRPILITFITTVFGAIPLAITSGHAGQYQKPMAIALIFGLSYSVFITLMCLPVVYSLLEDFSNKVKNIFKKKKNHSSKDETSSL
ncbi:efflux RND transporter permease subunit [Cytobacillus purgationiresistens]|uniref:Multidrug efflux pump subunit AcrB n=1 Tax=Cytobacillus purgationiresistens TaxID=863449 RepID=A0ABU0AQH1_9BACI|nr:efflux RND transporter permease subunit [Cytobacillus purgationiresistens]MDQ0272991.1 multidrug efflux pump subunit AcrB [Cytobacillus purgationiresistens]